MTVSNARSSTPSGVIARALERPCQVPSSPESEASFTDRELRMALVEMQRELVEMRNSSSWKLTAPLRALTTLLRSLRRPRSATA